MLSLRPFLGNWFLLATVAAVIEAVKSVLFKQYASRMPVAVLSWAYITALTLAYVPLLWTTPWPDIGATYWAVILIRCVLEITALLLYVRALATGDISAVLPLIATGIVFVAMFSTLTSGEFPGPLGLCGVLAIALGAYVLGLDGRRSWADPFKRLVRPGPSRDMLLTALLWSICTALHKVAIGLSSVPFYAASGMIVFTLLLTPVAWKADPVAFRQMLAPRRFVRLVPLGLLGAVAFLCLMYSLMGTLNAYASAVEHGGLLLATVVGALYFREPVRRRLPGIALITLGAFLIANA